ncbi:SUMF1/EgtB/PvdO family nonheme iron enzyme [bacterium]|nr:SUMF1/EgtB/PvdO family nonheme iron enzyme [bacterium]
MTDPNPHPEDDGDGAHIHGNVDSHTFVGRDYVTNVTVNLTGAELGELAQTLRLVFATQQAHVRGEQVLAGDKRVDVSTARIDALRQYLDVAPGTTQAARIDQYLLHLCVNPDFHRWHQRYVALSGGYRSVPELTPNYSAILVRGEGPQRQIERVPLPDIRDALNAHRTFVLLAQPGAGKTTVLRRIALDKAAAYLQSEDNTNLPIPLFVQLSAQKTDESPPEFLARMWGDLLPGRRGDGELADLLRRGRLCILCDALNEARREKYAERLHDWRDFAAALPTGNQLIFSCRKLDYGGELAVQQVEIDPLDEAQIQEFAVRYLGDANGARFWRTLTTDHADLLDLAEIPYYLHMLVEVFEEQQTLPPHRAHLFEQFVLQLFAREQRHRHPVPWIDPAAQHLALSELAYAMQAVGEGTEVSVEWAVAQIPQTFTLPNGSSISPPPADVLALARAASFLAERSDGMIKFTHHLMQEYFAAEALLRRLVKGEDLRPRWQVPSRAEEMPPAQRGEWDPLPGPPTTGWEQTTILAAGLHPAIYDAVAPVNPALAARCLLESGAEPHDGRRARSRQDLRHRLGDVAIHLRSRIEAGLLLGQLGDPRFPVQTVNGVRVILPPLVEIDGGVAAIGSADNDDLADSDEKPRHEVTLKPFAIGRYPVINAEFRCFVEARGYEDESLWTEGGRYWLRGEAVPGEEDPADYWLRNWRRFKHDPTELDRRVASGAMTKRTADNPWRILIRWTEEQVRAQVREWYPQNVAVREPRFWQDKAFNNPSQPVVGICWYEAVAYANWLASVSGDAYRLPSEVEWEWAARRGGNIFPWGDHWDVQRLNSLEGEDRVMRTTPVGVYPHGATDDGIVDLAGNVYERTATRYAAYAYDPAADLENMDTTGLRIARGGGWAANRKMVRCAYRNRNDAGPWNNGNGFRLARTSL